MIKSCLCLAASALLLAACAQTPTTMRYNPDPDATSATGNTPLTWPALPEVPRYRYTGTLLGEQNFSASESAQPGLGERLLRWVVGLGKGRAAEPRVLVRPQSGTVDAGGRILVTDVGRSAVFVFAPQAGTLSIWNSADADQRFTTPVGICALDSGEILVADAGLARVVRLDGEGNPRGSFGANLLQRPTGMACDSRNGQVFVADTAAHDIKVFDAQGTLRHMIGGPGVAAGQFNAPTHLAVADGRLYVSDTLNARIQVLSLDGRPLRQIGRRGLYVGNLTRPKGVAVDADGNLYVIESYYDHLLVFDDSGNFLLPIGGSGKAPGQFWLPAGAWTDQRGRLFVADMYNGRVVVFQYLGS